MDSPNSARGSLAVAAAALAVCAACKSDKPATGEQKVPPRTVVVDAQLPGATPSRDATAKADPLLATPMQFATRTKGTPAGVPDCPTADACLVEVDYAYFLMRKGWPHYYILDHGAPKIGLRKGAPTPAQVDRRLHATVHAALTHEHARQLDVHCAIAHRLPRLLRLGTFVTAKVPADPGRRTADPIAARTPQSANRNLSEAGSVAPFFSKTDRATMTGDTFKDPRVSTVSKQSGTPDAMVDHRKVVVWSPESRRVYVLDLTAEGPLKQLLAKQNLAKRRAAAETTLIAHLQSLQLKSVKVDSRRLCSFSKLTGTGAWLRARL